MSNRVRLAGGHPLYGNTFGGKLSFLIKESWRKKFPFLKLGRDSHLEWNKWPQWKRSLVLAREEGGWTIKVFREMRGAKGKKSRYGQWRASLGIIVGKKKYELNDVLIRKKKVPVDPIYRLGQLNGNINWANNNQLLQPPPAWFDDNR